MSAKRKYKRLSETTWAELRALWEVGTTTLDELADRFGVSTRTLQAQFAKHGTVKGSKAGELAAAVREEVFRSELTDQKVLVGRAKAIREATYANAVHIERLTMAQLELAQKDPGQAFKAASAMKMLHLAAGVLERLHTVKQKALGLDKDSVFTEELPVLEIRDLTAKDIAELHARDENPDELIEDEDDAIHDAHDGVDDDDLVVVGEGYLDDNTEESAVPAQPAPKLDADGYRYVRGA